MWITDLTGVDARGRQGLSDSCLGISQTPPTLYYLKVHGSMFCTIFAHFFRDEYACADNVDRIVTLLVAKCLCPSMFGCFEGKVIIVQPLFYG
jgi:hypothetical protein